MTEFASKSLLSPREMAQAIGVSESSIKRWSDDGLIHATRTAGGHRRIPLAEAIRYIRESRATVVEPQILGLPDLAAVGDPPAGGGEVAERLYEYLHAGAAAEVRGLLLSLYLEGRGVAQIADDPVRRAMERLGELFRHDGAGIFIEHRATDICIQAVHQLRLLITPEPGEGPSRPRALGGAPGDDPYLLPSLIAATALTAEGFHTTNLGPHTPFPTLVEAAGRVRPRLVWLSISASRQPETLTAEMPRLAAALEALGAALMVGGRACEGVGFPAHPNLHIGSTMSELTAFARGLAAAHGAG